MRWTSSGAMVSATGKKATLVPDRAPTARWAERMLGSMAKSVRRKPGPITRKIARVGKKVEQSADMSLQATAAMGGALLSAGASPIGTALIAGGSTVAAGLVGGAFKFLVALAASRWRLWYAAYTEGYAADPALVEAQLQAEAEDPIVQELVVENARAIAEALTSSVVPVLARLTREYRSAKQRPDAFFRGMRRLLSDLSDEEFEGLREVLTLVATLASRQEQIELQYLPVAPDQPAKLSYLRPSTTTEELQTAQHIRVELGQVPQHARIFHVLKVNGLGKDATAGGFGSYAGPDVIVISLATARRIVALLN